MHNGIAAASLARLAHDIRGDADRGIARHGVHVAWVCGTRARVRTLPMTLGPGMLAREFAWTVDAPAQLGGRGEAPSAQEYLLSGLGACLVAGFAVGAAVMGIRLTALEIDLRATQDLAGPLGLRSGACVPLQAVDYTIRVSGNASQEQFERLRERAQTHSPFAMSLLHGVPLHGSLEVESCSGLADLASLPDPGGEGAGAA